MPKEYISIAECAKDKKIARNSVYLAIGRGKLDTEIIAGRQVIIKNDKYNNYQPKSK
jgi:hypothetical protein